MPKKKSGRTKGSDDEATLGTVQDQWEPEPVFDAEPTRVEDNGLLDGVNRQLEQARSQVQRLAADFENLKKRSTEERTRAVLYANEALILSLLDVLDDFDRAVEHLDLDDEGQQDTLDGIRLIHKRLVRLLSEKGLHRISCLGQRFDPLLHEVVQVRSQEGMDPGTVLVELLAGYLFRDRVLRVSKVAVTPLESFDQAVAPNLPAPVPQEEKEAPAGDFDISEQDSELTPPALTDDFETEIQPMLVEEEDPEALWELDDNALDSDEEGPIGP